MTFCTDIFLRLQPLEKIENCHCKHPKILLNDFIFKQQENLADNQNYQAESRPLCNKILFCYSNFFQTSAESLMSSLRICYYNYPLSAGKAMQSPSKCSNSLDTNFGCAWILLLKVSKSQKQFFLKPPCPINKQNIWQNSTLFWVIFCLLLGNVISRKNSFEIYWPLKPLP